MARSVAEWIGASPDTPIPPRVRLRVFEKDGGRCQCGCGRQIRAGDKWQTDHTVAIVNGGENRETNLRTLLDADHKDKTKADVAEKARVYRKKLRNVGIRRRKGRPFPGGRDSGLKRKIDGTVVPRDLAKTAKSA